MAGFFGSCRGINRGSYQEKQKMPANTDAADVNEILLGYYALGGTWTGFVGAADAKKQLNAKKAKIGEQEYSVQGERAKVMAKESLDWAKKNGYKGKVKKVWWTARPGVLSKAVGYEVDSRKNPTDTLLLFTDGQFLGLSAKSTKGKGDIGFKNPGVGTIDKALRIDLKSIVEKKSDAFAKTHGLSSSKATRKREIRADKNLVQAANIARDTTLKAVRDAFGKKLKSMSQKDLREHILNNWMDAGDVIRPPYIKVTGHGKKAPFTASILDPLKDDKTVAVQKKKLKVVNVGNDAVGIDAGGKKIMKARAKFESQAMASSLKFSGEPW
jgi:hypothetical protein